MKVTLWNLHAPPPCDQYGNIIMFVYIIQYPVSRSVYVYMYVNIVSNGSGSHWNSPVVMQSPLLFWAKYDMFIQAWHQFLVCVHPPVIACQSVHGLRL